MPFGNIPLEEITEEELHALVLNQVRERKTIDYKQELHVKTDHERKEFLADVSSFANAAGGYLIFGVKEETGLPIEVCGIDVDDPDTEVLRLGSIIRSGIRPRMPGLNIWPVTLRNQKIVILVRIPRSFAAPHMLTAGEHFRFYSRNSAGKHRMDVSELRNAFALLEQGTDKIRRFRMERLASITADEMPISLSSEYASAKIVLHIVPYTAFDPSHFVDLSGLGDYILHLPPLFATARWFSRYNFDGFLTCEQVEESRRSYLQIFRNGCLESVNTYLLRPTREGKKEIMGYYENMLLRAIRRYLAIQARLSVEPPLLVMLSFLGVRGYTINVEYLNGSRVTITPEQLKAQYPIDRDDLVIADVMVEGFEVDLETAMRPAFDAVWNAAGWPRSLNYDLRNGDSKPEPIPEPEDSEL